MSARCFSCGAPIGACDCEEEGQEEVTGEEEGTYFSWPFAILVGTILRERRWPNRAYQVTEVGDFGFWAEEVRDED